MDVRQAACFTPLTREPLDAAEAEDLAPPFKAIGDPVRLRPLSMIACHEAARRACTT